MRASLANLPATRQEPRRNPEALSIGQLSFVGVPAQAGAHLSTARALERWMPAFAGMTMVWGRSHELTDHRPRSIPDHRGEIEIAHPNGRLYCIGELRER